MRAVVFALFCFACSSASPLDPSDAASATDAATDAIDDATNATDVTDAADAVDAADGGCFVTTVGTFGDCISTSACATLGDHVSTPGYCPGPADIECCTEAPDVADNPPVPSGWKLMAQADVTQAMTNWAVMILNDPTTYPMFSTTTQTFGSLEVLARVEWHPPDFQNEAVHRGVTLYEPAQ